MYPEGIQVMHVTTVSMLLLEMSLFTHTKKKIYIQLTSEVLHEATYPWNHKTSSYIGVLNITGNIWWLKEYLRAKNLKETETCYFYCCFTFMSNSLLAFKPSSNHKSVLLTSPKQMNPGHALLNPANPLRLPTNRGILSGLFCVARS